jgi:UDPglucose 6-dehydrogenase
MNICIIGTGYVGLVAGTCFAENGHRVICVDIDKDKVDGLNNGVIPIYEPGLSELVKRNKNEGRLTFTNDIAEGVCKSSIIFIAVGTPSSHDGTADLTYVLRVAKDIASFMKEDKIVVLKSTVPVGTFQKVKDTIKNHSNYHADIVNNPEFLKEGAAIEDFMKPDRVVIGCENRRVKDVMKDLYSDFMKRKNRIIFMDNVSAELTKYACNAFLATKVTFANEMANLCEKVGANYSYIREGMGSDARIGNQFLYAGVGFGGSCFPKDIRALARVATEHNSPLSIVDTVEKVNEKQKSVIYHKIKKHFNDNLEGKSIAIWGVAFKPKTDDIRESPSINVIEHLLGEDVKIRVFDPEAMANTKKLLGDKIEYYKNCYDALKGVDAMALLTEWREFRHPDFDKMKELMKSLVIFDGRNQYDPYKIKELGFTYYGIGC